MVSIIALFSKITSKLLFFTVSKCVPELPIKNLPLFIDLETQFTDGMSWDNRSEWHIDHIIPLSSAKTEDELYKLCHYENLQPLWAEDNLKKGARILS
jgi:hypothetical protein